MKTNFVNQVKLRDVIEADLPIFFEHQQDPDAIYMAAFTSKDPTDRAAFMEHWSKIFTNTSIFKKTIIYNGRVVGHVSQFEQFGHPEVSYWIGKEYWGKGIATTALLQFLPHIKVRPIYARAAKDNKGSIRVLEKCGFTIIGEDTGYANARGMVIEEFILKLEPVSRGEDVHV